MGVLLRTKAWVVGKVRNWVQLISQNSPFIFSRIADRRAGREINLFILCYKDSCFLTIKKWICRGVRIILGVEKIIVWEPTLQKVSLSSHICRLLLIWVKSSKLKSLSSFNFAKLVLSNMLIVLNLKGIFIQAAPRKRRNIVCATTDQLKYIVKRKTQENKAIQTRQVTDPPNWSMSGTRRNKKEKI